jgi:hypothetical protein
VPALKLSRLTKVVAPATVAHTYTSGHDQCSQHPEALMLEAPSKVIRRPSEDNAGHVPPTGMPTSARLATVEVPLPRSSNRTTPADSTVMNRPSGEIAGPQ